MVFVRHYTAGVLLHAWLLCALRGIVTVLVSADRLNVLVFADPPLTPPFSTSPTPLPGIYSAPLDRLLMICIIGRRQ